MKCKNDPEYKARYDARPDAVAPILMHEGLPERIRPTQVIIRPKPVDPAPPPGPTPEEVEALRTAKITARNNYLELLNDPSPQEIIQHALYIISIWTTNPISGLECAAAYTILKYFSIKEFAPMVALLKAVAKLYCSTLITYSEYNSYSAIPAEQTHELLEEIKTALVPFGEFNILKKIPKTDKYFKIIRNKIWNIEDEERRVADEAARAAAAAAALAALDPAELERRRLFNIQLRVGPVVFDSKDQRLRDPEGGINLAGFAADHQNIHRSSVQTSTQKAVAQLMLRSTDPDQITLPEIIKDLQDPKKIRITGVTRERVIMELNHDYYECVAFSVPYGDVLDRVWTFIRSHKHRDDIFIRLAQEIAEGIGMCTNGKMARLVNVLQGFDETLLVEAPKEVFQDKFALLRKLPNAAGERGVAAQALFEEFSIPEAERAVWLEALLEE
jgi:hypothetical protein